MKEPPYVNGTEPRQARSSAQAMADAIVHAVAYVDVFDYPLTAEEIHRYLVGIRSPAAHVYQMLRGNRLVDKRLAHYSGYYTLPGREEIVEIRRRRQALAARIWPHAIRYGQRIAAIPFVRMVAVTGSLAVDNAVEGADIDYLIVTEAGRLWVSRALAILVVRMASRRGVHLCPNYLLSENALVFQEQNLYTAHELVQMIPVAGMETYRRMRRLNRWTDRFLPNAGAAPRKTRQPDASFTKRSVQKIAETPLRLKLGDWLESWEMNRKISKFATETNSDKVEAAFCPDWCKGHFEGHGKRIMEAYRQRLRQIENGTLPR